MIRAGRRTAALALVLSLGCTGTPSDGVPGPPQAPAFLASIRTPTAAGTAVLLAGRRLVTSAHVVWPHENVTVRFAGGREASGMPVIAVDWMADIALIDVSSMEDLPDAGTLAGSVPEPGDPVSLAGHDDGEPVVLEGTVTEIRRWSQAAFDLVLTDVDIPEGSSGGAILDASGDVAAITGISIDGAAVGLASADVLDRLAATSPSRWPTSPQTASTGREVSSNVFDEIAYAFDGEPGATVELAWDGAVGSVTVTAPDGVIEATEDDLDGGRIVLTVERPGMHVVSVLPDVPSTVDTRSSVPLRLLAEPEDGLAIRAGRHVGVADYPGDLDWFALAVPEDADVTVTASSTNIDPAVAVAFDDDQSTVLSDSDSAGGVLSWDAAVAVTTTRSGVLLIAVLDEGQFGPGSYVLDIDIED